ncbi:MAG: ATP-binding protein [Chloroflexi bacterium]|nr:ATP-binding protein [Chloroflexota bacterium]
MESLEQILTRLGQTSTSDATSQNNGDAGTADREPHCDICDDARWVRLGEPMGSPGFGKMAPCECQEQIWEDHRGERLKRYANLGPLERLRFDTALPDGRTGFSDPASFRAALECAIRYSRNPEGWLVILGPSGSGKTHLAAAVANQCVEDGRPVFFIPAPQLLDQLRTSSEPGEWPDYDSLFQQVVTAPLLVLDDLGTGNMTPWAEEKMDQILTSRYNARRPTVVTSGIDHGSMPDRMRTRLLDPDLATVCEISGPSGAATSTAGDIPQRMLDSMTFELFDPRGGTGATREQQAVLKDALGVARGFAQHPDRWLYLAGPTGTGKTHLAVAIAGLRIAARMPVTFAFVPDLLDKFRQAFSPDSRISYDRLFDQVKNAELLILDDLGAHSSTAWAEEKLYQLIVHRYNAALPTVITSRVMLADPDRDDGDIGTSGGRSGAPFSAAIMSRLRDGLMVTERAMIAPDYRHRGVAQPKLRRSTGTRGRGRR